eukprot:m.20584 g.20584  ORF g.20584 m.20584 type:complete len:414 (+) comp6884_c0_seq1:82-1323(+)
MGDKEKESTQEKQEEKVVSKKNKYRRDKPWDHEGIDHWKLEPFKQEDVKGATLVDETVFTTLFPKYREHYLRDWWPQVTSTLKQHHIECVLDLIEGSMTVRTTRKTWDPYIIIKARDFIKLLARSVPFPAAVKVLDDDTTCDIIKIGGTVSTKERFVKRRQRLIGPDGSTLKAIELLTQCYVLVQGNTVAAVGNFKGLKQVRKVVMDCMNNIHPIYNIKELMIKKELANDEKLKNESWDRFLPKFKKKNIKKKKVKIPKQKEKPLFPPEPTPSKVDLQIESGEYFLKEDERLAEKRKKKEEKANKVTQARLKEREKSFVAPKEPKRAKSTNDNAPTKSDVDIESLKKKLKKSQKSGGSSSSASDFVLEDKSKKMRDKEKDTKKGKKRKASDSEADVNKKKSEKTKKKKKSELL